mgnify:CR=1 FL=1
MLPLYPDDFGIVYPDEGADDNVLVTDSIIVQVGLEEMYFDSNSKATGFDRTNMTHAVKRLIEHAVQDDLPEAEALLTYKARRDHLRELVREDVRHSFRKRMGIDPRKGLVQAVTHRITDEFAVGVKGRYYVCDSGYEPETRDDFRDTVLGFFEDIDVEINVKLT